MAVSINALALVIRFLVDLRVGVFIAFSTSHRPWIAFYIKTVKILRSGVRVDDRTMSLIGTFRNERPSVLLKSFVQSIYQRDYARTVC